ncbi:hypothetical protein VE00_06011 [Pseudogymnoascus sp. WSF 3629]|nr:hypothetical protein VE00_06011 [Pseudogymnoascus sp. WSF 3629]
MEPLIRETQPPAPLRSRRRNFGNVLLFVRLLSFLVSLATFAILIRYCIAQYKNGAMGGGVLGSVGSIIAAFIDWEQVGALRHTRDKIGNLSPRSTAFMDAVALGFSVGSVVVIVGSDQKSADKVVEFGGPTNVDRRAATALLATIAGFRIIFFIFGAVVETGRFIARRRWIRRNREEGLMSPGGDEVVTA